MAFGTQQMISLSEETQKMRRNIYTNFVLGLVGSHNARWKYIDFKQYDFSIFSPDTLGSHTVSAEHHPSLVDLFAILKDTQHHIMYNGRFLKNTVSQDISTPKFILKPLSNSSIHDRPSQDLDLQYPMPSNIKTNPDFQLLNYAIFIEGSDCVIRKQATLEEPIYIVNITDADQTTQMVHPRTHIVAEEGSRATIIEILLSLGDTPSFTNSVTHVELKPGAHLNHIVIQQTASKGLQFSDITVHQAQNTHYYGTTLALNGRLNRITTDIQLDGSGSLCEYSALAWGSEKDHIDIHLNMQHLLPHCQSRTVARGVMGKRAKGAFTGKITVHEGAKQTNAALENKNLLLSLDAEMNTCPELEVYNDDLQCAHGATVGHLDPEALFYLKSRGIPEPEAKKMLIEGFVYPCIQSLPPHILKYVQGYIYED